MPKTGVDNSISGTGLNAQRPDDAHAKPFTLVTRAKLEICAVQFGYPVGDGKAQANAITALAFWAKKALTETLDDIGG